MKKREKSFFGLHFDLHPKFNDSNLGADISEENIRALIERVSPDYVTYDCKGHEGYCGYESQVGFTAPNIHNDSLKLWRKVTEDLDVSMGVHYSGLQDFVKIQNNPEMGIQRADGTTDGKTASVFSSYADDYMILQLKEVIKKYNVNGVWLDAECWGAQLDYSPNAMREWKKYSGTSVMPKSESDENWQEFKEFNRINFEKYLCHWVDEIKREYPEVDCCSNWAYTTMMPKDKKANVSMLSGDFDPFLSLDRARTECRYLENTGLAWELQSWGFDLVDGQGPCQKMPAQIMQEAAVVMMHGGGYMNYFLPTRGGYISDTIIDTLGKVSDFARAREEVSHFSAPVYECALLYPTESQLKRSNNAYAWWGNRLDELEGVLHSLLESGHCATILAEHQLEEKLKQIKCLFVPENNIIHERSIDIIKKYVSGGGKLVLLGANVPELFKDMLEVELKGCETVNAAISLGGKKIQANGVWRNVTLNGAESLVTRYMGSDVITNSEYIDDRETVTEATRKLTSRACAVSMNRFGKGQVGVIYSDFGGLYFKNHHPYLRDILEHLTKKMEVQKIVETNAPKVIDVSARISRSGNLTVHLLNTLNMPVGSSRKFTEYIPKLNDIDMCIACDYPPSEVKLIPENSSIPFEYDGEKVKISVKTLEIHCAIELKR